MRAFGLRRAQFEELERWVYTGAHELNCEHPIDQSVREKQFLFFNVLCAEGYLSACPPDCAWEDITAGIAKSAAVQGLQPLEIDRLKAPHANSAGARVARDIAAQIKTWRVFIIHKEYSPEPGDCYIGAISCDKAEKFENEMNTHFWYLNKMFDYAFHMEVLPDTEIKPKKKYAKENAVWKKCAGYLREALALLGVSAGKFEELAKVASEEVIAGAQSDVSNSGNLHALLDVLSEDDFIAYLDWKSTCEDVAAVLSRCAMLQGLPPIPEGMLEQHPMQQDPHSSSGYSEMFGGMAAVYIAQKISDWNILLIDVGTDGHYACVVPLGNAEAFRAKIKECFAAIDFTGSVSLLTQ